MVERLGDVRVVKAQAFFAHFQGTSSHLFRPVQSALSQRDLGQRVEALSKIRVTVIQRLFAYRQRSLGQ